MRTTFGENVIYIFMNMMLQRFLLISISLIEKFIVLPYGTIQSLRY